MLYDSSLWLRAIKALQLLLAVHGEITEKRTVNFGCEGEKPVVNIQHHYTWGGLPASARTLCLNSQKMRDSEVLSDCKALDSLQHPLNSTMNLCASMRPLAFTRDLCGQVMVNVALARVLLKPDKNNEGSTLLSIHCRNVMFS